VDDIYLLRHQSKNPQTRFDQTALASHLISLVKKQSLVNLQALSHRALIAKKEFVLIRHSPLPPPRHRRPFSNAPPL
jgi:hypothetical protein